jgi:hypothetical protein
LDAARKLYESFGFKLQKEEQGAQWGSTVTEQQLVRYLKIYCRFKDSFWPTAGGEAAVAIFSARHE